MEKEFFHWFTARALSELGQERQVGFNIEIAGTHKAHFYYPARHRYPRRQIGQTIKLIAAFSDPNFTRALGHYGEMLVESGFARTGFRILQQKVRSVDGLVWKETNHDLDFLIVRDGIRYGVEVKNQLGYIDQTEFQIKLKMCAFFGVRPMFITRMMPKNYFNEVYKAGGYSVLTDNQNYPLLAEGLAKRVRDTLTLPVGNSPRVMVNYRISKGIRVTPINTRLLPQVLPTPLNGIVHHVAEHQAQSVGDAQADNRGRRPFAFLDVAMAVRLTLEVRPSCWRERSCPSRSCRSLAATAVGRNFSPTTFPKARRRGSTFRILVGRQRQHSTRTTPCERVFTIDASHSAYFSQPVQLTRHILTAGGDRAG